MLAEVGKSENIFVGHFIVLPGSRFDLLRVLMPKRLFGLGWSKLEPEFQEKSKTSLVV